MFGFLVFAAIVGVGISIAAKKGLFKNAAGAQWGLSLGERMVDMFTIARTLQPLTRGQIRLMTAANIVGMFAGFTVGQSITLMTMVVTDRRVIWALDYGNASGPRAEFSAAAPARLEVMPGEPGFRPDGLHQARIVTLTADHLDRDYALVLPEKFLNAPPPYMVVSFGG
jgi:hypothetical protein